jgi:dolichol-phosphate mannosyltransferase
MQENQDEKINLSVVMPVFSEQESIIEIIKWLEINCRDWLFEIIVVVSPMSIKETKNICKRLVEEERIRLFEQEMNPGLGWAYRQGLREARGTHILMLDSDGEMDLESIPLMIKTMREKGCSMVVGSRWVKGGGVRGYDGVKYLLNRAFQYVFRLLYRTTIHDLTLGFKLMKRGVAQGIDWESTMHEIATETTLKPIKYGYKVCEVPARWVKRQEGRTKNRTLNNLRYVVMAFRILLLPRSR